MAGLLEVANDPLAALRLRAFHRANRFLLDLKLKLSLTSGFWTFQEILALPLLASLGSFAPPTFRGFIGVKLVLNEVNGRVRIPRLRFRF